MVAPGAQQTPPTFQVRIASDERADILQSLQRGYLSLHTSNVLPIDTEVKVDLLVSEVEVVPLTGRVFDIEIDQSSGQSVPVGMGVRLIQLTNEARDGLAAVIAEHAGSLEALQIPEDADTLERSLVELRARLQHAEDRRCSLASQLQGYSEDDRATRALVERLEGERRSLGNVDLDRHVRDLSQRCEELRAEERDQRASQARACELGEAVAEAKARLDAAVLAHQQLLAEQETVLGPLRVEVERLASELAELQRQVADTETQGEASVEPARCRAMELEEQLEALRRNAEEQRGADLPARLAALKAELVQKKADLEDERRATAVVHGQLLCASDSLERLQRKKRDQARLLTMMLPEGEPDRDNLPEGSGARPDFSGVDLDGLDLGFLSEDSQSLESDAVSPVVAEPEIYSGASETLFFGEPAQSEEPPSEDEIEPPTETQESGVAPLSEVVSQDAAAPLPAENLDEVLPTSMESMDAVGLVPASESGAASVAASTEENVSVPAEGPDLAPAHAQDPTTEETDLVTAPVQAPTSEAPPPESAQNPADEPAPFAIGSPDEASPTPFAAPHETEESPVASLVLPPGAPVGGRRELEGTSRTSQDSESSVVARSALKGVFLGIALGLSALVLAAGALLFFLAPAGVDVDASVPTRVAEPIVHKGSAPEGTVPEEVAPMGEAAVMQVPEAEAPETEVPETEAVETQVRPAKPTASDLLEEGRAQLRKGFVRAAAKTLKNAARADPSSDRIATELGSVYFDLGENRDAVAELQRALQLNPKNSRAARLLGSALWEAGNIAGAKKAFERFLELAPNSPQAKEVEQALKGLSESK